MSEPKDPTLLRTKLHRPAVAGDVVARPHLVDLLERNRKNPLNLVCTPAGGPWISHAVDTDRGRGLATLGPGRRARRPQLVE